MTKFVSIKSLAALAIAPWIGSAIQTNRNHDPAPAGADPDGWFKIVLDNTEDMMYTSKVRMGGQELTVIPDTGSYEYMLFSTKCDGCGNQDNLYDPSQSSSLKEGDLNSYDSYGSGDVESVEAYDVCEIGGTSVPQQMFWEVTDANMPVLEDPDSHLSGILGLGAPNKLIKVTQAEWDEIEQEVQQLEDAGQDLTPEQEAIVQSFKAKVDFVKNVTLWVQASQVLNFSVCFGRYPGSPGIMTFNNPNLDLFHKPVQVTGDRYWAATMQNVQFSSVPEAIDGSLGCGDNGCEAILDTGTSLIVVPSDTYYVIMNAMQDFFDDASDGCDNMLNLPHINFTLGDQDFSLPARTYVARMDVADLDNGDDEWMETLMHHMPHLKKIKELKGKKQGLGGGGNDDTVCTPLIMTGMDGDPDEAPMWILGMPFFRAYHTLFELSEDSSDATQMRFHQGKIGEDHCDLEGLTTLTKDDDKTISKLNLKKIVLPKQLKGGRGSKRAKLFAEKVA